ncbi:MAG: ribulose-phosphate 3-epimerase [Christensenella sp.]|nr:ribulose-phosphate 3-epimerase [Christensenella sp.]
MNGMISPSMMCADLSCLKEQIDELERAGIEYLHCDVMDGIFVPNYSLGTDYISALRQMTDIPLDLHLMVEKPDAAVDIFDIKQNDIVCVHQEACVHTQRVLQKIRARGAKAGLALNPGTSLAVLDYLMEEIDVLLIMTVNPGFAGQSMVPSGLRKIAAAKKMIWEAGREILIEVDGNVSFENARKMRKAGADLFVTGSSSIFSKSSSISDNIKHFRSAIV